MKAVLGFREPFRHGHLMKCLVECRSLMARQIKNQEDDLASVILNLGGFHTDMSYLGTIGHIMQSSGLKEMLCLVYPENTVRHMLSGKAVYRAMRGYFIVDAALNIFIIKKYLFKDEQDAFHFKEMFKKTYEKKDERLAIYDEKMSEICDRFKEVKENLKAYPTGEIWIQFMDQIDEFKISHRAQRTGDATGYLNSLVKRQPNFPATGHRNYGKSVPVFTDDTLSLKDTNPEAWKCFDEGFFFVRRSERYWAALPPDLVIEQVLMASLKNCKSGITHGRGTDELQRLIWLFSRGAFAHLKNELEHLYKPDEKMIIKELTSSRIKEDTKDILKTLEYIEEHDPFDVKCEHLVDISTGISYPNANAHKVIAVGNSILEKMNGTEVNKYKFKKADQIKQMGGKVMIGEEEMVFDPLVLFERALVIADSSDITKKEVFEHELSLNPPSLFGNNGLLRSADDKANLTDHIAQEYQSESTTEKENLQIESTVIDMGSLLWAKVIFNKGDTYGYIIQRYVNAIQKYPNCVAVFDSYNDDTPSIKYITHLKRSSKVILSHTVQLALHLPFTCDSKAAFFANRTNKQEFINLLSKELQDQQIEVLHAKGDADQLIAKTAIDLAVNSTTQVLSEDTDIFQLLVSQLRPNSKGLYMITGKENAKHPCLDIKDIRNNLGDECAPYLPVIHAMSGCDTTSKPFGIGKLTIMKKRNHIIKEAGPFLNINATHEEIEEAGRKILCLIYDGKTTHYNLNEIRLKKFEQNVIKSVKHVNVEKLPPTNNAAKHHSYRVYLQVQLWLGNDTIQATDWGWELNNGKLYPRKMDTLPAPKALMKILKCGCTQNCDTNKCTCKKNGLFCTELCDNCTSGNCINVEDLNLLN